MSFCGVNFLFVLTLFMSLQTYHVTSVATYCQFTEKEELCKRVAEMKWVYEDDLYSYSVWKYYINCIFGRLIFGHCLVSYKNFGLWWNIAIENLRGPHSTNCDWRNDCENDILTHEPWDNGLLFYCTLQILETCREENNKFYQTVTISSSVSDRGRLTKETSSFVAT